MMEETLQGGTRMNGQSPLKQAGLPVISVITIVYNGLSLIEKTIRSIIEQNYPNIEYIVIDGGSTDGTVEIIKLYEKKIAYWVSEPDQGIYDAMNKGLAAATGEYVWFINAGDRIYTPETTGKIFTGQGSPASGSQSAQAPAAIYYGDTMIVDTEFREVGLRRLRPPERLNWKSFRKGMLVCHQAILVARDIAEPFDPQYKHSADFDWVVRALKRAEGREQKAEGRGQKAEISKKGKEKGGKGGSIINTHMVLCAFLDGGHSKQNIGISLKERFHSMVRHYGWFSTVLRHIPIAIRFIWYYLINKRF